MTNSETAPIQTDLLVLTGIALALALSGCSYNSRYFESPHHRPAARCVPANCDASPAPVPTMRPNSPVDDLPASGLLDIPSQFRR
jgi:hypothetical protein